MAEKVEQNAGDDVFTDLDQIARRHQKCSRVTVATYYNILKVGSGISELLHALSLSSEFNHITVRDEETQELAALSKQLALSTNEHLDPKGRGAKVNILLRAFIAQLEPEGSILAQDMVNVGQIAGRTLVRAIFDISLYKGWARVIDKSLRLCKLVERRIWHSMTPLRQVQELQASDDDFPSLQLSAYVQPITRTMLQVEVTIEFTFEWNDEAHGSSQAFWVFIEEVNSEVVLYSEYFLLEKKYRKEEHDLGTFPVLLSEAEPWPPLSKYCLRVVSNEWIDSETRREVLFTRLILPQESPRTTTLQRLQTITVETTDNYVHVFTPKRIAELNFIQKHVFESLYKTNDNVFVGAPMGSGKSVCAEFAILQLLMNNPSGHCVYMAPNQAKVDQMYKEWSEWFSMSRNVFRLTGEATEDLRLLKLGFIVLGTPEQWDVLSTQKEDMITVNIRLFIVDDLHLIGGESGPMLEVVCSRMRFISDCETKRRIRIVAFCNPVDNAKDLGNWLDVSDDRQFNFRLSARPIPLITEIRGFGSWDAPSRLLAMAAPVRSAVTNHSASGGPVIVFVPSWRQSLLTAQDLVKHGCTETVEGRSDRFLLCSLEDIVQHTALITDETLREMVGRGVGYLHEGLPSADRRVVEDLFAKRAIRVLVVSQSLIWSTICQADLVIIMDTQHFDGQQHRHIEYQVADVLQMVGLAEGSSSEDKCILMCQNSRKDYYKKVLSEPLPVESHLDGYIHSFLTAEIVTGTIRDKTEAVDCLNWTFLSHRMYQNPSYYNLQREFNDDMSKNDLTDPINDLVDKTLENLVADKMCTRVFEDHAKPCLVGRTLLGSAASWCNIDYETIVRFVKSLLENQTTLTSDCMIGMMSRAKEFDDLPIRFGEESVLDDLKKRMKFVLPAHYKSTDPHVKTNLLLQAHMYSIPLSLEVSKCEPLLLADTGYIVEQVPKLLQVFEEIILSGNLQLAGAVKRNEKYRDTQWYHDLQLRKRY